jgi:hypothetical protein
LLNLLLEGGSKHEQNLMFILILNFESINDLIKGMK